MQTKRRHWERGKTWLADAPCRPRTPAREGGGRGAAFPGAVPLTHPQLPLYQLPYAGVRIRWQAPRIGPRTVTQPPALSKARDTDSQGMEGCRTRIAPHTCTPGASDRGSRRSSAGPGGRAPRSGLVLSASPPPQQNGRAGGRTREIRSHNIGHGPSPPRTFRRGGGTGAVREPGTNPDRAPDSPRVSHRS